MPRCVGPSLPRASFERKRVTVRAGSPVAAALLAALLATSAPAQSPTASGSGTLSRHDLSLNGGAWEGPWQLGLSSYLEEITNANVLPSESGKVLFWCRVNACDSANNFRPTETWLWDPAVPGVIPPPKLVPNGPETDFFCCGATFDSEGNLVVVGGHDAVRECLDQPFEGKFYGSFGAFRFPFVSGVPASSQQWQSLGTMTRSRWYPTALALADGSVIVTGHFNAPNGPPPLTVETMDRWTSDGGWAPSAIPNKLIDSVSGACGDANLVLTDYPRTFVLAHSGDIMVASGVNWLTAFLRPNDPACSVNPWRWRVNQNPLSPMLGREGGPAVHYVVLDETNPNVVHDVVYVMGGGVHDDACLAAPFITATVDKMRDPNVTKPWDTSAPDMHLTRVDANAVVLLDGSILVVGGLGDQVAGTCPSRLKPELYRPPEIFPDSGPWSFMATQQHERRYHSVAGLLPDGRVFSAGGDKPAVSHHSIELYNPPYLFKGQRPVIAGLSTNDWSWNHPVKLSVTAAPGATIVRAALLRPGAITHAFDMNQRYVQLRVISTPAGADPFVTVKSPKDWNVAPPGYYFLTVIDSEGRPSPGRLVHVH